MIEGVNVQLDCPGLISGSAASLTNCFVSLCLSLLICKMERILPTHMVIASIRCIIPSKMLETVRGIKVSSMLAIDENDGDDCLGRGFFGDPSSMMREPTQIHEHVLSVTVGRSRALETNLGLLPAKLIFQYDTG